MIPSGVIKHAMLEHGLFRNVIFLANETAIYSELSFAMFDYQTVTSGDMQV